MKVALVVDVTPYTAGLYETVRELASALRFHGIDARLVDTRPPTEPFSWVKSPGGREYMQIDVPRVKPSNEQVGESDRGVPIAPVDFLYECDIISSHRGLARLEAPGQKRPDKPVVHVVHGMPDYSYVLAFHGHGEIIRRNMQIRRDPNYMGVVTMWERYIPYMETQFGEGNVHCLRSWVDLDRFRPGPTGFDFHGQSGKVNIMCADYWRENGDPFHPIHGFIEFAKRYDGAKLHIFGLQQVDMQGRQAFFESVMNQGGDDFRGPLDELTKNIATAQRCDIPRLQTELKTIQDKAGRGILGDLQPIVPYLHQIYPEADVLISYKNAESRVVKEALACGTQVVGGLGLPCTPYTADIEDLPGYADAIDRAVKEMGDDASARNRAYAEANFDVKKNSLPYVDILEGAVDKWRRLHSTPQKCATSSKSTPEVPMGLSD